MQLFERATEGRGIPRPLSALNIFPGTSSSNKKKPETSNSDNNPSSIEFSSMTTSTPQHPQQLTSSKSNSFTYWQSLQKKNAKKMPVTRYFSSENLHGNVHLRHEDEHQFQLHQFNLHQQRKKPPNVPPPPPPCTSSNVLSNSDEKKRNMQKVFHDLDTFIEKELNEIQVRKRMTQLERVMIEKAKEVEKNNHDEKFYSTLQMLKNEVREIKENQKEFEKNMKRHSISSARKHLDYGTSTSGGESESYASSIVSKKSKDHSQKSIKKMNIPPPIPPKKSQKITPALSPKKIVMPIKENQMEAITDIQVNHRNESSSSVETVFKQKREEKISRLESELYKAETLMMKINRVLENVGKIDDNNIDSIINIERHYLVASTRFQSALTELRKINESVIDEDQHPPPFNRKGRLVIREIMLEVKSAYFQRKIPTRNEYIMVLIKYDDRVMASNTYRIENDIRIVKFPECFSIPEAYADFEMRLEIYGTNFYRKSNSIRETMLKKYGFVTFTLADTGKKHKRFNMIEVMQAENVPIRSKVLMRITQKITAGVQYRGLLFVKIREIWYETSTHLNGHILEISFKSFNHNSVSQSRETILLDLYNYDSDAVIPVDTRVSKRPFSFSLKFNHYVDVANF